MNTTAIMGSANHPRLTLSATWRERMEPVIYTQREMDAAIRKAMQAERDMCASAARMAMVNDPQADELTCSICAAAIRALPDATPA